MSRKNNYNDLYSKIMKKRLEIINTEIDSIRFSNNSNKEELISELVSEKNDIINGVNEDNLKKECEIYELNRIKDSLLFFQFRKKRLIKKRIRELL